jgi:hypothetical protein
MDHLEEFTLSRSTRKQDQDTFLRRVKTKVKGKLKGVRFQKRTDNPDNLYDRLMLYSLRLRIVRENARKRREYQAAKEKADRLAYTPFNATAESNLEIRSLAGESTDQDDGRPAASAAPQEVR